MLRFVAKDANHRGSRAVELRALVGAALMAAFLPGCPLSDNYYVDASGTGGHGTASGGETTLGGGAGIGFSGGTTGLAGGGLGAGAVGAAGSAITGATGGSGGSGGKADAKGGRGSGGKAGAGGQGGTGALSGTGGGAGSADCSDEPERCDGVDNDCNGEIDDGAACPKGCSVELKDNHRYVICIAATKAEGWDTDGASTRCGELAQELDLGASFELAWIESKPENDFLRTWLQDNVSGAAVVWIGASDRDEENVWVWGTGTEAVQFFVGATGGGGAPYMNRFNDWAPGSPRSLMGEDQDCGAFDTGLALHWDDRDCNSVERGFICEEDPAAASPLAP